MESSQSGQWYALAKGTGLRDYTIESVLGQGGFGIVYRARHNEVGHFVAIKEFLPAELVVRVRDTVVPRSKDCEEHYEDGLRRFRDEARALIKMNGHPNIVACMDFFRANGTAYLVMEFVDGQPLSEVLRGREVENRPFEEAELLAIAVPLAEGLAHVHRHGVLHRDIKPANVLIRRSDGHPVLIDFGAAKQGVAVHTRSFAPYTDGYAALEQVSGGALGPWTDLYGFGALMWRLVAGGNHDWKQSNPSKVESRVSARFCGDRDPLPPARELGGGRISLPVLRVIDRCLELKPEERLQGCDEALKLLSGDARPEKKGYAPQKQPSERSETPAEEHQDDGGSRVQGDRNQQDESDLQGMDARQALNEQSDLSRHARVVWSRLKGTFRGSRHIFSEIAMDPRGTRHEFAIILATSLLLAINSYWWFGDEIFGPVPLGEPNWSTLGLFAAFWSVVYPIYVAFEALAFRIVAKWFNPKIPSFGGWFRVLGFINLTVVIIALVPYFGFLMSILFNWVQKVIATSEMTSTRNSKAFTIVLISQLLFPPILLLVPMLIMGLLYGLLILVMGVLFNLNSAFG